jgi:hypothetical protein
MFGRYKWVGLGIFAVIAVAASVNLSSRTVDFQVYYLGAGDFFRGLRPVYGALSGVGWPMHYRYPPLFLFLFAPLTLLPMTLAAGIWVGAKFVVLGYLLKMLLERLNFPSRYWWVAFLIAGPFVIQEFQYGNVQFFTFALVAFACLLSRTKPLRAGAALALATSIKVWPLFFFPYLLVRRDWKTLGAASALTVLMTLLPIFYFGVGGTFDLLGQWTRQEVLTQTGSTQFWYPSQSLRGVLMRYLTVIDYSVVPDSEYPRYLESIGYQFTPDDNYPLVEVADLDPALVRALWFILAGAAYAGLLALAFVRRHSDGLADYAAAWCALVLLQPFTQKYALAVLLWPALIAALLIGRRVGVPRWVRIVIYASTTLIALQPFLSGSPLQRNLQVVGLDFVATCLLGLTMVWVSFRRVRLDRESPEKSSPASSG